MLVSTNWSLGSKKAMVLALSSLMGVGLASAQGAPSVGIAGYVGSLGIGGEGSVHLNDKFSVNVGVDTFAVNAEASDASSAYSVEGGAFLGHVGAGFHPFSDSLRLSGGVMMGGMGADGTASITESGITASGSMSINLANPVQPYATVGFATQPNPGFGFYGEIGVAYTGGFNATVTVDDALCAGDATCEAEVATAAADLQTDVQDSLNLLGEFYPLLRIGLRGTF